MRNTFFTLICFLSAISLFGKGYQIDIHLKGAKDSAVYLAIHFGGNKYVKDTCFLDKNGNGRFVGEKPLDGGMYLLALGGAHILDFLISDPKHQEFSISAVKGEYTQTLNFKNSPENQEFADFTRFMYTQQTQEQELSKKKTDELSVKIEKQKIEKEYRGRIEIIEQKYPGTLLYSFVKAMQPIQIPDEIQKKLEEKDSTGYALFYQFQKKHFWDNYTLTDIRLQNTPILIPAVDNYFDRLLPKSVDTLNKYIDLFLNKSLTDTTASKFFTGHLFNLFIKSEIMGMESVVIHIIDNYYLTGKVPVNDEKFMKDIREFSFKNAPTLLGRYAAPLKMESLNGGYESLYDIESPYTLVYFFEPSCGHCKQETPKVYEVYNKFKNKGLAAYCVYTQSNKQEWVEYVAKNNLQWTNVWDPTNENNFRIQYSIYSVPQVYLLNKDKKIIGRRLTFESLEKMLEHLIDKKD